MRTVYRYQRFALVAGLLVLPVLWAALPPEAVRAPFAPGFLLLALYLARKLVLVYRNERAIRQLGREGQFLRYLAAAPHLSMRLVAARQIRGRSCLASVLCRTLRPSSFPVPPEAPLFERSLHRLGLGHLAPDVVLPVLLLLQSVPLLTTTSSGIQLAALLGVFVLIEAYQLLLRRRMTRQRHDITRALPGLTRLFHDTLARRPYRHKPLYLAHALARPAGPLAA